jgi:hypothetical protein
LGIILARAIKE